MVYFFNRYKALSILYYIGIIFVVAGYSNQSFSQELTLDDFIYSILKNNPGAQKILTEKDIANSKLESSLGIDDAQLVSSIGLFHTEPNKIFGFEPTKSDDTRLNLSYNRLFSETGTRLSLGYTNQYTDRSPALSTLGNKYYQPSFTVRLIQPLLKNYGGIQDQLNIKLNKINVELAHLSTTESLESYITQLATLYIDWHLAAKELKISREVYKQSLEQEKLTRIKVKRQVIEPHELFRVQEIREGYYSRWQQAKGRYSGLTHRIRYQMNLTNPISDSKFSPISPNNSKLLKSNTTFPREESYLKTTSRLKNILNSLKQQQIILLEAKNNAISSDLNLNFDYTRQGVGDTFQNSQSNNFKKDNYSIFIEYKYLFGNRQAESNYKTQLIQKRQIEFDTRQRLINAQASLANLKEQLSQIIIAVRSSDKKISLAKNKLKKEKYLYKIGKLDLFELLRDQTSQLETRLNREKLFAQKLILKLQIGELLDQNIDTYSSVSNP